MRVTWQGPHTTILETAPPEQGLAAKLGALPTPILMLLFAGLFLLVGAGIYYGYQHFGKSAPSGPVPAAAATKPRATNPIQKYIEVVGIRLTTDAEKLPPHVADKTKLLIASCGNQVAKVVSAVDGKEVASIPIGKGPDAVIYDDQRQLAFIPCGRDGVLEVISVADPAKVALVQHVPTQTLARTGALDPQSGRIYLMTAVIDTAAGPGPAGRPVPKSGSFELLVVGPQ